jgi:lysophospholipase L1-like esterase
MNPPRPKLGRLLFLTLAAFMLQTKTIRAQSAAFMYQGSLIDGGSPANGAYDLEFSLYDASTNGNLVGQTFTNSATPVSNGLFAVALDFGNVFNGSNYWLQIGAQTNGGIAFTPLKPRQPITPVPDAVFANTASNLLGTLSTAQLNGLVAATQLPTNVVTNGASGLNLTGTFNGNGAGLTGLNATQLASGAVSDSLLPPDVAKNNDAYTVTWATNAIPWATNASPYPTNSVLIVNALQSYTNNGPIHWLTTPKTTYLALGYIPSVGAYGNPDQTVVNGFEFGLNGNEVTICIPSTGASFNIQVDGGAPQAFITDNYSGLLYFTMTFNSYANRLIRFEGGGPNIIDLEAPATNAIIPKVVAAKKILIVGDSFSDGANHVSPQDTFAYGYLKFHPNVDVWVDAVGGSGYCHGIHTNDVFINRLVPWVFPHQFDAIIVTGGYNDGGTDSNTLYNAASLYYQTIRSHYPNAFLGVVLPFNSLTPLPAGTTNAIYAIRAACRDNGLPFIDPSGSGTNDVPGANPWIYGYYLSTGNAGGNAAAYISSDGTHPTPAGHLFLEANLDAWITTNIFPSTASQTFSANGAGLIFTNAAGARFSLLVNATTNGFIFISQ